MIIHNISNWDELRNSLFKTNFKEVSETHKTFAHLKLFRGQKDISWKLQSKIDRHMNHKSSPESVPKNLKEWNGIDWYESEVAKILEKFKVNLSQIDEKYDNIRDIDAMMIGRHHGLITPLLDWTTNPLKALFFALEEIYVSLEYSFELKTRQNKPISVFKLNCFKDLLDRDDFKFYDPVSEIGSRIHAQSGCFTVIEKTTKTTLEDFLESIGKSDYLEKYIINESLIDEIIERLYEAEINPFTLYPDLVGASLDANINMDSMYAIHQMDKVSPFRK